MDGLGLMSDLCSTAMGKQFLARSDCVAAPQGSVTGGPSVTVLARRVVHRLLWPCKLQLAEIEKICC